MPPNARLPGSARDLASARRSAAGTDPDGTRDDARREGFGDAHPGPYGGAPVTAATASAPGRAARGAAVPDGPTEPAELPDLLGELRAAGERLLAAVVSRLSELALEQVDDLAAGLERMASGGGVGVGAAVGAGRALAAGGNVVWGAIKGGFAALGTAAKILVGVVVALAPVLLIVALVVLIVAALVWAVVAAVRAATS